MESGLQWQVPKSEEECSELVAALQTQWLVGVPLLLQGTGFLYKVGGIHSHGRVVVPG